MYCDSDVDFTRNVDHNFIDSGSDFLSEFDIGDGGGGREHLFCCDLYVWCFCLFVLLSHVSNVQEEDTVFLCGKLLTEMNTVTRKWRLNMNSLTSDQRTVIFVLKYVLN